MASLIANEMSDLTQVTKSLRNSLKSYRFTEAKEASNNEQQTRELMIEPVLKMLGYDKLKHWIAEADGGFGKRVDFALNPFDKAKGALIIIEAKKQSEQLKEGHFRQLREYFLNVPTAQFGFLTNGIEWNFYAGDGGNDKLHPTPFFTFNVMDYSDSDVENLAKFHTAIIDPKSLYDVAQDIFELAKFDEALFQELSDPSYAFIKQIVNRMGYARSTQQREEYVREHLNHFSIKDASDRMLTESSNAASSGIVTTAEELQAYRTIRTLILASSRSFADLGDRISYRDLKNQFSILFDNSQRNPICTLDLNSTTKKLWIGKGNPSETIETIDDIVQYKSRIIDAVKSYLGD